MESQTVKATALRPGDFLIHENGDRLRIKRKEQRGMIMLTLVGDNNFERFAGAQFVADDGYNIVERDGEVIGRLSGLSIRSDRQIRKATGGAL